MRILLAALASLLACGTPASQPSQAPPGGTTALPTIPANPPSVITSHPSAPLPAPTAARDSTEAGTAPSQTWVPIFAGGCPLGCISVDSTRLVVGTTLSACGHSFSVHEQDAVFLAPVLPSGGSGYRRCRAPGPGPSSCADVARTEPCNTTALDRYLGESATRSSR